MTSIPKKPKPRRSKSAPIRSKPSVLIHTHPGVMGRPTPYKPPPVLPHLTSSGALVAVPETTLRERLAKTGGGGGGGGVPWGASLSREGARRAGLGGAGGDLAFRPNSPGSTFGGPRERLARLDAAAAGGGGGVPWGASLSREGARRAGLGGAGGDLVFRPNSPGSTFGGPPRKGGRRRTRRRRHKRKTKRKTKRRRRRRRTRRRKTRHRRTMRGGVRCPKRCRCWRGRYFNPCRMPEAAPVAQNRQP